MTSSFSCSCQQSPSRYEVSWIFILTVSLTTVLIVQFNYFFLLIMPFPLAPLSPLHPLVCPLPSSILPFPSYLWLCPCPRCCTDWKVLLFSTEIPELTCHDFLPLVIYLCFRTIISVLWFLWQQEQRRIRIVHIAWRLKLF